MTRRWPDAPAGRVFSTAGQQRVEDAWSINQEAWGDRAVPASPTLADEAGKRYNESPWMLIYR